MFDLNNHVRFASQMSANYSPRDVNLVCNQVRLSASVSPSVGAVCQEIPSEHHRQQCSKAHRIGLEIRGLRQMFGLLQSQMAYSLESQGVIGVPLLTAKAHGYPILSIYVQRDSLLAVLTGLQSAYRHRRRAPLSSCEIALGSEHLGSVTVVDQLVKLICS